MILTHSDLEIWFIGKNMNEVSILPNGSKTFSESVKQKLDRF